VPDDDPARPAATDPADREVSQEAQPWPTAVPGPDRAVPGDPADVWRAATTRDAPLVPYRPAPVAVPRTVTPRASSPVRVLLAGADVTLDALMAALGDPDPRVRRAGDAVLGAAWTGYRATSRVAGVLARPAAPLARVAMDPPLVPPAWRPATLLDRAALAWQQQRHLGREELGRAWATTVPEVVDAAVAPIDLTALVLDDVQLDVLARAVVEQLDLTGIVLTQVDLKRVAEAVIDTLDLTAVAREHIDLPDLAEEVIDAIDLPEIIRESTGSVASETVRTVRMQSIQADDRVEHLVDRVLAWRSTRNKLAPEGAAQSDDDPRPR
jgi:hypothetical protein